MMVLTPCTRKHGTLVYHAETGLLAYDAKTHVRSQTLDKNPGKKIVELFGDGISINGNRAKVGKIAESARAVRKSNSPVFLMLVNTTRCNMRCSYCYARNAHGQDRTLDSGKLHQFLSERKGVFSSIAVYGGESLMDDGLAALLRKDCPDSKINFVTGFGFQRDDFERKINEALKHSVRISLSIDPLREDGGYDRKYTPYPGSKWYDELLDRAAWLNSRLKIKDDGTLAWGVRPTLSKYAFNFRKLRSDIARACGVPQSKLPMTAEAVTGGGESLDQESLNKIVKLLDEEVDDISNGRLNLEICGHLRGALALVSPFYQFSPGGCYDFTNRLSLGPDGELSFCNEVPVSPDKRYMFGDNMSIDPNRYAQAIKDVIDIPETLCRDCWAVNLCGVYCPVKLSAGDRTPCEYNIQKGLHFLMLLADMDTPESVNVFANERLETLRRWENTPAMQDSELKDHAEWLMRSNVSR